MSTDTMTTTQVNRVFIKATPEAIWNAVRGVAGASQSKSAVP